MRTALVHTELYVYYTHYMNSKGLIKKLKEHGWELVRVRGSHHHFVHKDYNHIVTVPHPKKDLKKPLVKAILKQADIS